MSDKKESPASEENPTEIVQPSKPACPVCGGSMMRSSITGTVKVRLVWPAGKVNVALVLR